MARTDIDIAKAFLTKCPRYNKFLHNPLMGEATRILSTSQLSRAGFKPILCNDLQHGVPVCEKKQSTQPRKVSDQPLMKLLFPQTYGSPLVNISKNSSPVPIPPLPPITLGVAYIGRQAPGGHDVIAGLFDSLPSGSKLLGFVGGTVGLLENHTVEITKEKLAAYRGSGGFELLGRSIDATAETSLLEMIAKTCGVHKLDGLLLIGGTRTSTMAAYLSEYLLQIESTTKIITVPVGVSGSLKNEFVETMVGFNTACRVAGQIVGNNATDGASAKKYYYFMRLMGEKPSHSTLEVALETKPNYVILGEEVDRQNMTLVDIVRTIADMVEARASVGKNYGTICIVLMCNV